MKKLLITTSTLNLLGNKRKCSPFNLTSIDADVHSDEDKIKLKNKIIEIFPNFENKLKEIKGKDILSIKRNENYHIDFIRNEIKFLSNEKISQENYTKTIDTGLLYNDDELFQIKKEKIEGGYIERISKKENTPNETNIANKFISEIKLNKDFSSLNVFQRKALNYIGIQDNLLISSYGGKTEIINVIFSLAIMHNSKLIYVSTETEIINKKFNELQRDFNDNVGLMNEEVNINENAICILMTNKILKKLLIEEEQLFEEIFLVIFDDIEYINDPHKSNILEETIILLPDRIKYIFLSEPFPNSTEFGEWISLVKDKPINIICSNIKQIPLKYYLYPIEYNNSRLFLVSNSLNKYESLIKDNFNDALKALRKEYITYEKYFNIFLLQLEKLILFLDKKEYLPIIIITFSINEVEEYSYKVLMDFKKNNINFINEEDQEKIEEIFMSYIANISPEEQNIKQISELLIYLKNGIGLYHNGMIPILNEIVQSLFEKELIKIIFSTKKINISAKTIIFSSIQKYDGENETMMSVREINKIISKIFGEKKEKERNVIFMIDKKIEEEKLKEIIISKTDEIKSSFSLSYNQISYLFKKGLKEDYLFNKSFMKFQIRNQLLNIQNKLAILYKVNIEYLETLNNKYSYLEDINIKKIKLFNTKRQLNINLFNLKYIEDYLIPGRIVNLNYFGYGIIFGKYKISFLKSQKYENLNIKYIINNNCINIGNEIIDGGLKIKDIYEQINNSKDEDIIITVLIPAKNLLDDDYYSIPNNFDDNSDIASRFINVSLSMIKSLYKIKMVLNYKSDGINELDEYIKRLQLIISSLKGNLPEVKILETKNITDKGILELSNQFLNQKEEYENSKEKYYNIFLKSQKNGENILEKDLEIFENIINIQDEINFYIFKSKKLAHLELNDELNIMKKIMKKLNYLDEDNTLTKKGLFLLNISRIDNIDEILTVELIYKNYFENLKGDNLTAILFYCFSKKKFIKKNYINHDINLLTNKNNIIYNFNEIFLDIQKEENIIKAINDRYITLDEIDKEIDIYINIICQWTKYSSFKNILLTNENLLEGKIIKTINKFANFINHLSSYNNVLSKSFEKKLKNLLKKIKRGIPFYDCSFIE